MSNDIFYLGLYKTNNERAMERIFSFVERWKVPLNSANASFNGTRSMELSILDHFLKSVFQFIPNFVSNSRTLCDVIKQNESEVGSDMLLVSDY